MRNLSRISNYYNNIEARNDYAKLQSTLASYGLAHLMIEPTGDTWRRIDKAATQTKAVIVHLPHCPKCENGGERGFTAPLSDIIQAEGYICCDYCDTPLYPIETKMESA